MVQRLIDLAFYIAGLLVMLFFHAPTWAWGMVMVLILAPFLWRRPQ